jgi:anti-anti-sigma factor
VVRALPFEINSEWQAETGVLTLSGELDLATAPRVEEAVQAMLGHDVRNLTVDLGSLSFMDSSGLRLLIVLDARATSENWTLALTRPQESVRRLLQVSGVEENLPFVEDRGSA